MTNSTKKMKTAPKENGKTKLDTSQRFIADRLMEKCNNNSECIIKLTDQTVNLAKTTQKAFEVTDEFMMELKKEIKSLQSQVDDLFKRLQAIGILGFGTIAVYLIGTVALRMVEYYL